MVRPAVGLRLILEPYSGLKKNEMWGRFYIRQIFAINTAGLNCRQCGVKCDVRPAVGFGGNVITAVVRRIKCGAKALLDPLRDLYKFGRMYFDLLFCVKSVKSVKRVKLNFGN